MVLEKGGFSYIKPNFLRVHVLPESGYVEPRQPCTSQNTVTRFPHKQFAFHLRFRLDYAI